MVAKICFVPKRFGAGGLEMIEKVNTILEDYESQGYTLTLRQLYYQLVAHDLFPDDRRFILRNKKWIKSQSKEATKNAFPNYKWLGELVSDGRDAGLIDWESIEDRGRVPNLPASWRNPGEIAMSAYHSFRLDRWEGQRNYVEVMCEKDALTGILLPVCRELHVRFTANKGYSSSTAMFEAGERFRRRMDRMKGLHIIYFGDHDPSGLDMSRDIRERLLQYSRANGLTSRKIHVHRVALNYDQVQLWNPPPNFAKESDSRIATYRDMYGDESWELDAVDPATLANLVREQIESLIDQRTWNQLLLRESGMKEELLAFAQKFRNNGSSDEEEEDED